MSDPRLIEGIRCYYESLPEPLRSVMLNELDYAPSEDALGQRNAIRIPTAEAKPPRSPRRGGTGWLRYSIGRVMWYKRRSQGLSPARAVVRRASSRANS